MKQKKKAIERWREQTLEQADYHWTREIFDSLKGLFDACNGVSLNNWNLSTCGSSLKISFDKDDAANLSGTRAMAWIENNLLSKIRVPFSGVKRLTARKYGYKPGTIEPCPFTGYCSDDDFLEALLEDIKNGHRLIDCFKWLAHKYDRLIDNEIEWSQSKEFITDTLIANEYEFTIDGELC